MGTACGTATALTLAPHIGALVQVPGVPLLHLLPANTPGKAAEAAQVFGPRPPNMGKLDEFLV